MDQIELTEATAEGFVLDIHQLLAEHQAGAVAWSLSEKVGRLHEVKDRLIHDFKIMIDPVAIGIERLGTKTLGQYRESHNALGIEREILISKAHIENDPFFDVCGTLLHELLHAEQTKLGRASSRRNYHNAEFRERALELGLIVDEQGGQGYAPNSPFFAALDGMGVSTPALNGPWFPLPPKPGKSTLSKWVCQCAKPQHFRGGASDYRVMCLDCGARFKRDSK